MDLINRSKVLRDVAALHKFTQNPMVVEMLIRCLRIIESEESGYAGCWIPIGERLPEYEDVVIVTYKNGICMAMYDRDGCWRHKATQNGYFSTGDDIKTVTACMPLPNAYNAEDAK